MDAIIRIADVDMRIVRKDVRHLHLTVLPPLGNVRITAPAWMDVESIRLFGIDKLGWVRRQQRKMREQPREAPHDYIDRESHYLWGERYLLQIVEGEGAARVERRHRKLLLHVRKGANTRQRDEIFQAWYREQLRQALPALLSQWVPLVGKAPTRIHVQRMKTKWGSCNPDLGSIRLNSELARKPRECLDYILLHELMHLVEPGHGTRFIAGMDRLMPQWRERREVLNQLPLHASEVSGGLSN